MKVTIVGAGNVGASCAEYILIKQIAKEVILDIQPLFDSPNSSDFSLFLIALKKPCRMLEQ